MARGAADDVLFTVPPARFTAERKRVAAALRAAGASDAAKAVESRRKPSLALWAANQAARADRRGVDALIESVDRLTSPSGRGAGLRPALARQRDTLAALLEQARNAIASIDGRATPDVLARVQATLTAAAVDRGARAELRAGRLGEERAAPGFEVFERTTRAAPRRR